jgi:hypothetical protein
MSHVGLCRDDKRIMVDSDTIQIDVIHVVNVGG